MLWILYSCPVFEPTVVSTQVLVEGLKTFVDKASQLQLMYAVLWMDAGLKGEQSIEIDVFTSRLVEIGEF